MVTKLPKWSQNYRADASRLTYAKIQAASRSKVFIAIDLEWDESNPSRILEVGLAILDLRPRKLHPKRTPPSTWDIRPRHIIISENRDVHNSKYVRSNKFGFKFGKSYFARDAKARETVQAVLDRYEPDEVVLVGHLMGNDLRRLEEWGVVLDEEIDVLDTAGLERVYMSRVNGRKVSLESMCEELDVPYYRSDKLHNAGNDAFFTMAAFLEMCVDSD
jgi:hypothetical protein